MGKRKRADDPEEDGAPSAPRGKSAASVKRARERARQTLAAALAGGGKDGEASTESSDHDAPAGGDSSARGSQGALADALQSMNRTLQAILQEQQRIASLVSSNGEHGRAQSVKLSSLSLDEAQVLDIVPLASILFWSRGGWNARWTTDKSRYMIAALDGAIAHICGPNKSFELLAADARALVMKKVTHKVDNSLRVSFHFFCLL